MPVPWGMLVPLSGEAHIPLWHRVGGTLIGCGEQCHVMLPDERIAVIHCALRLVRHCAWIRTGSGLESGAPSPLLCDTSISLLMTHEPPGINVNGTPIPSGKWNRLEPGDRVELMRSGRTSEATYAFTFTLVS